LWFFICHNEHINNATGVNDMTEAAYNDMTETHMRSGRHDGKGREIGYIVGLNNNGTTFAAWVQNARRVNGEWQEFGVRQQSKKFSSQDAATRWAYKTANERISKL
jgi:hypothetical protein